MSRGMSGNVLCTAALLLVAVLCCGGAAADTSLGRGFGDHIDWRSLDAGLDEVYNSGRPGMVVIHATWCGACRRLKPLVAESNEIAELSKSFVMINVQDAEDDRRPELAVDGAYVPRIYFVHAGTRDVRTDLVNEGGNPKYLYYYPDAESIVRTMRRAIETASQPPERPVEDAEPVSAKVQQQEQEENAPPAGHATHDEL